MTVAIILFATILSGLLAGVEKVDRDYIASRQPVPLVQVLELRRDMEKASGAWQDVRANWQGSKAVLGSLDFQVKLAMAKMENRMTIMEAGMSPGLEWKETRDKIKELIEVAKTEGSIQ